MKARTKPKLGLVRLEGWGLLSDLRSAGMALRRDGEFVIVRTHNPSTGITKDWKFRLDSGKMAGTSEVAGTKICNTDLLNICQRLGAPLPNVEIAPKENSEMATTTLKKKVKGKVLSKNGHKKPEEVSASDAVNEVIKKSKVGRPKKEENAEDSLPETKESPKRGRPVGSKSVSQKGKKGSVGRPRTKPVEEKKEPVKRTGDSVGKRGPLPKYEVPTAKKGEVVAVMSEGAYRNMMENHLPNVRSKKTTDEEKALVERLKAAKVIPVKGAYIVFNKGLAKAFLALSERLAEAWTNEGGVAAAHWKRGTVKTADILRETFNLKGGITAEVKEKPVKNSTGAKRGRPRKVQVEETEEEETPAPKRKVGRPSLKKKKVGAAKGKSK